MTYKNEINYDNAQEVEEVLENKADGIDVNDFKEAGITYSGSYKKTIDAMKKAYNEGGRIEFENKYFIVINGQTYNVHEDVRKMALR